MLLLALLFTASFAPANTCYVTDSDFIKSNEAVCKMLKTFQDADGAANQWVSSGQDADGNFVKTLTTDECLEPESTAGSPHKIIEAPSNCIFAKLFDEATIKSPEKDCFKKADPQKGAICFVNLVPPPQQVVQQQAPVQQQPSTCEEIDAQMKAPGVKMGKMLELVALCDGMSKPACKHNQIGSGVHECVPSGTANRVGMGFSESKNYIPAGCFLAFVSVASYVLVKQCRANKDDYQTLMSDEDQL